VKKARWVAQTRADKWAQALNFWWIINLSGSDKEKEKQKN
jgi:hypothetical protein